MERCFLAAVVQRHDLLQADDAAVGDHVVVVLPIDPLPNPVANPGQAKDGGQCHQQPIGAARCPDTKGDPGYQQDGREDLGHNEHHRVLAGKADDDFPVVEPV